QPLADALDGQNRDQRDESGEQRVLDQILAFLFPNEALEQCFHLELSPQGELLVFAPNLALSSKRISVISRRVSVDWPRSCASRLPSSTTIFVSAVTSLKFSVLQEILCYLRAIGSNKVCHMAELMSRSPISTKA